MVRTPIETLNITISVFLKNGTSFIDKDIPNSLFGQHESFVSFWDEDSIVVYPLDQVQYVQMKFKEK